MGLITRVGRGTQRIFLRADIDALPTQSIPQHLCGHSTHTASLMGAYLWLQNYEKKLIAQDKEVLFVFQPAEETYPSGAKLLMDQHAGILTACLYGFGVHVDPLIPPGSIRLLSGEACGAGDYIEIVVTGKQYHIKNTHKAIDAIEGAALVVQAVRAFARQFPEFGREVVFNLNTIEGGTAPNITADSVKMTGDIRWIYKHDQKKIKQFFTNLPQIIQRHYGGAIQITYYDGYPPVYNDPKLTATMHAFLREQDAKMKLIVDDIPTLGIEDFAFYTHDVPCLYADIGIGGERDLHEEGFIVPDTSTLDVYEYWKKVLEWWLLAEL